MTPYSRTRILGDDVMDYREASYVWTGIIRAPPAKNRIFAVPWKILYWTPELMCPRVDVFSLFAVKNSRLRHSLRLPYEFSRDFPNF